MAIVIRKVNFIDILRTNIIISTNIKYIYLKNLWSGDIISQLYLFHHFHKLT